MRTITEENIERAIRAYQYAETHDMQFMQGLGESIFDEMTRTFTDYREDNDYYESCNGEAGADEKSFRQMVEDHGHIDQRGACDAPKYWISKEKVQEYFATQAAWAYSETLYPGQPVFDGKYRFVRRTNDGEDYIIDDAGDVSLGNVGLGETGRYQGNVLMPPKPKDDFDMERFMFHRDTIDDWDRWSERIFHLIDYDLFGESGWQVLDTILEAVGIYETEILERYNLNSMSLIVDSFGDIIEVRESIDNLTGLVGVVWNGDDEGFPLVESKKPQAYMDYQLFNESIRRVIKARKAVKA